MKSFWILLRRKRVGWGRMVRKIIHDVLQKNLKYIFLWTSRAKFYKAFEHIFYFACMRQHNILTRMFLVCLLSELICKNIVFFNFEENGN